MGVMLTLEASVAAPTSQHAACRQGPGEARSGAVIPGLSLKVLQARFAVVEKCSADLFPLRGRDVNAAITQDKADIGQARLRTDFRLLPDSEVISMLRQQLADQREASPVLGLISLGVFLDLHDLPMGAPNHQQIWCVAVLFAFMVVFQSERLLLPCVGMRCGEQDPECSEFVQ